MVREGDRFSEPFRLRLVKEAFSRRTNLQFTLEVLIEQLKIIGQFLQRFLSFNTFDLYLPKDQSKTNYSLVVYLHAGGFTSGDKADDKKMLQWLADKEYVTAKINYTLWDENNPNANIYTQSLEIKNSMPKVIEKAKKLGYPIQQMSISGTSAGHTLAMLYAYRDAATSPVPVKMVFGAVGLLRFIRKIGLTTVLIKTIQKLKRLLLDYLV